MWRHHTAVTDYVIIIWRDNKITQSWILIAFLQKSILSISSQICNLSKYNVRKLVELLQRRECNPGTQAPENLGKPADFQGRKPGFVCGKNPGSTGLEIGVFARVN